MYRKGADANTGPLAAAARGLGPARDRDRGEAGARPGPGPAPGRDRGPAAVTRPGLHQAEHARTHTDATEYTQHINMSRHEPETYTITLRRTPIRFPFVPLQLKIFLLSKINGIL